jgi:hypothetical protein
MWRSRRRSCCVRRLAAAGIDDAGVSVPSPGSLTITAPAGARADVRALTARGELTIYDWERSVLGPEATSQADAAKAGSRSQAIPR